MHVLLRKNAGATDYWRFPWLRRKGRYSAEWKPPILHAALLERYPDLKYPFLRAPELAPEEVYYPLEETPGISRQFAELQTVDEVLAFANTYGLLGLEGVPRYRGHQYEIDANGENIKDWLLEANEIKQTYEVWDLMAEGVQSLRQIIVANEQGAPFILPKSFSEHSPGKPSFAQKRALHLKPERVLSLGRDFILDRYNQKMIQMASPMLLVDSKGAFHSYNRPSSLLGAFWLEFGEIVSRTRRQILCESCGKYMDVTENRRHKRKHDRCVLREKMARYRSAKRGLINGKTETR